MSAELVPFSFNGCQVRTVTINGEPRLVASDVCAFLGFMNSRQAVANHVIPEDRLRSTNSIPDNPNLLIVDSSELYASASPSFATGAVGSPPRLINTRPVSKGLHYKRVWDNRGSSERRDVILGGL